MLYNIFVIFLPILRCDDSYQGVLDFCDAMDAIEGQPLDSLAQWHRYLYPGYECFNSSYATHIARYSNVEWDQFGTDVGSKHFFDVSKI